MDTVDELHAVEDRLGWLSAEVAKLAEIARQAQCAGRLENSVIGLALLVAEPFCRCDGEDCEDETCGCACHDDMEWSDAAGQWIGDPGDGPADIPQ